MFLFVFNCLRISTLILKIPTTVYLQQVIFLFVFGKNLRRKNTQLSLKKASFWLRINAVYLKINSSAKSHVSFPAPKCQPGHFPKFFATIRIAFIGVEVLVER
ncbi:MAG: hypothetical protein RI922_2625 [Bacteroidota bacterium]